MATLAILFCALTICFVQVYAPATSPSDATEEPTTAAVVAMTTQAAPKKKLSADEMKEKAKEIGLGLVSPAPEGLSVKGKNERDRAIKKLQGCIYKALNKVQDSEDLTTKKPKEKKHHG